jgi:hypothetical protein
MKRFIVSYDLFRPGQNYQQLFNALEALGAKRALLSLWVLRGDYKAAAIRDHLMRYIDQNDRIIVAEMGEWATYGTMIDINTV